MSDVGELLPAIGSVGLLVCILAHFADEIDPVSLLGCAASGHPLFGLLLPHVHGGNLKSRPILLLSGVWRGISLHLRGARLLDRSFEARSILDGPNSPARLWCSEPCLCWGILRNLSILAYLEEDEHLLPITLLASVIVLAAEPAAVWQTIVGGECISASYNFFASWVLSTRTGGPPFASACRPK